MSRAWLAVPELKRGASVVLMMALAACDLAAPQMAAPPARVAPFSQVPVATVASPASQAATAYYANVQAGLLAKGLLRTDGGGPDTPFNDRMLAENFVRIALFDEYQRSAAGPVQRETASRLRKWEQPVRVALRFGASVTADRRATDTARISSYLARLARLTGHPIGLSDVASNFFLYIVNEDERRALGPVVAAALPGLDAGDIAGITEMPRTTYCLVYALSGGGSSAYTRAFAVIRAEHPDLLRLSCMHEEIAQGLGLANDSPRARPSIFNDDEEFALLTNQDELMLRMLYNPALRLGMTVDEATPIVKSLATAVVGGDS
jgi:hypothetical protein